MNHHQGNRDTDDPIYHQADLILSLNRETQTPYSSLGGKWYTNVPRGRGNGTGGPESSACGSRGLGTGVAPLETQALRLARVVKA